MSPLVRRLILGSPAPSPRIPAPVPQPDYAAGIAAFERLGRSANR